MDNVTNLQAARERARSRRAAGIAADFDPSRLTLARRYAGLKRTQIAASVGVTPAAITQYEKGAARPTLPVVAELSEALHVPPDFFRLGSPVPMLAADGAHFRSLRSTTVTERESALAFAELALVVFEVVEQFVELPPVQLPDLEVHDDLTTTDAIDLARRTREAMGIQPGPVPNMVRLLEAHGVTVVQYDEGTPRVDAFSHHAQTRPIVVLSQLKGDRARRRFDCAHELGHLVMHHDTEPGSRLVENQAHSFAAEFLAPADQLRLELPARLDWAVFHELKRRWGMSLKSLVLQAFKLGRIGEATYQRGMKQLSIWGLPEPGPLGPPEAPVLLPRALSLLDGDDPTAWLAQRTGLPPEIISRVLTASGVGSDRPTLLIDPR